MAGKKQSGSVQIDFGSTIRVPNPQNQKTVIIVLTLIATVKPYENTVISVKGCKRIQRR